MSRILLADDSSHAQRMGERILSDEGFEVVTVSDGESALIRLEDVDPDVVLADAVMPGRTGYDICRYVRMNPRHAHVRVILTAGALETLDEDEVRGVEADATLRKPFEATGLLEIVRRLAEEARAARNTSPGAAKGTPTAAVRGPASPIVAVLDAEKVRAAVTVALDASMGAMIEEITARVLAALAAQPEPEAETASVLLPARGISPVAAPAPAESPRAATAAAPFRPRPLSKLSILGLDLNPGDDEDGPPPAP